MFYISFICPLNPLTCVCFVSTWHAAYECNLITLSATTSHLIFTFLEATFNCWFSYINPKVKEYRANHKPTRRNQWCCYIPDLALWVNNSNCMLCSSSGDTQQRLIPGALQQRITTPQLLLLGTSADTSGSENSLTVQWLGLQQLPSPKPQGFNLVRAELFILTCTIKNPLQYWSNGSLSISPGGGAWDSTFLKNYRWCLWVTLCCNKLRALLQWLSLFFIL